MFEMFKKFKVVKIFEIFKMIKIFEMFKISKLFKIIKMFKIFEIFEIFKIIKIFKILNLTLKFKTNTKFGIPVLENPPSARTVRGPFIHAVVQNRERIRSLVHERQRRRSQWTGNCPKRNKFIDH